MRRFLRDQRGSGLLTAMMVVAVILMSIAGVLYYANLEQGRAVNLSRSIPRGYCVDTGLQLARTYFGKNFPNWNTYLNTPGYYNPVHSTVCNPTKPGPPPSPAVPTNSPTDPIFTAHPELFADLDGDGLNDVYIYIRDNEDELPPATPNCRKDNDLQVIVGAVCISKTLAPRMPNGAVDNSQLTAEALIQYNNQSNYCSQARGCGTGTNNVN
jgi:hypothetical protein